MAQDPGGRANFLNWFGQSTDPGRDSDQARMRQIAEMLFGMGSGGRGYAFNRTAQQGAPQTTGDATLFGNLNPNNNNNTAQSAYEDLFKQFQNLGNNTMDSRNFDASLALQGNDQMNQLGAILAGRGLGSSGVAGAAYGSLASDLLGKRAGFQQQNQQLEFQQKLGALGGAQNALNSSVSAQQSQQAQMLQMLLGGTGILNSVGNRSQTNGESTLSGLFGLIPSIFSIFGGKK